MLFNSVASFQAPVAVTGF